jgi:sugar phosphate isomerase/epimerase
MCTPNQADRSSSATRREFLAKLGVSAAGGMVLSHTGALLAATTPQPSIPFPAAPRDRISVASYPFRAYMDSPTNHDRNPKLAGMDLKDFGAEVVEKFNIHNIEPHSRHFRSLDSAYLSSFRATIGKANVKVVNIAVDGQDSFYDADPAVRKKAVAYAKQFVDVAVQIGSPSIRVHISRAKNSKPDVARTADSLREVVDYATGKTVVVNLENDDLVSEDAFFIVKVIDTVNHHYLHGLPDFANSMMSGNPDFDYLALTAMFERAYNICHVKDGEADDQGKYIFIDMQKSFAILKTHGFRGYCSMEYDATGNPYAPTAQFIEQTIRCLS